MSDDSLKDDGNQEYIFDYDSVATKEYFANRTAEKNAGWFLPYLKPGMTVLDCGCASGSITVGLAEVVEPGQVTGIDISEIEIERATERANKDKISNISFYVGDIHQLEFPDNSFDAVFSHNVLEHIAEPNKVLQEMKRVLKPGGIIGIRDIDYGGVIVAPLDNLIDRSIEIVEAEFEKEGGDARLARHLGTLLYGEGFVDVKMSASYEVFSDPTGCKFLAQLNANHLDNPDLVQWVTEKGLANAEEMGAMKNAWLKWSKALGAICAGSHCEVVGWKPK